MFGQSLLSAFGSAVACTTDTDQLFTTDVQTTSLATYQLNNATTSIPSNTYPGTASNITYAAGKFGNAAVFNGTSSRITSGLTSGLTGSYSVSAWFTQDNISTDTAHRELISYMDANGSTGWWIGKHNNTSQWRILGVTGASIVTMTAQAGWNHIAVVKDSSTVYVYLNGSQVTSFTFPGYWNLGSGNAPQFNIGTQYTGTSEYWDGSIDQVRIFNTALPQAAITALYNETATTATYPYITTEVANPNSVAYYKMSDATDQLGNYNGTATNVNFNTEGKFGFAGAFNGSSSLITLPSSFSSTYEGSTTWSFSAWVNLGSSVTSKTIFSKYNSSVQVGGISITTNGAGKVNFFVANTSDQRQVNNGNTVLSTNTWHNIVVIWSSGTVLIYVDGNADTITNTFNTYTGSTIPTTTTNAAKSNRFAAISYSDGNTYYSELKLDQVRIYDSALSAANVTALYNEIECPAVAVTNAFNTVLYTGNGSTQSVTGVGFKPDFSWVKNRNTAGNNNNVADIVRGVNNILVTNGTNAQYFNSTYQFNSFDTDGITVTDDAAGNYGFNGNNETYVSWNWKAGGTAVSNTDGTITSQVSANVDAGFSIVKYTGNENANQTVGHGLSQAPEIVFTKQLDGTREWTVPLLSGFSTGNYLVLNDTNTLADDNNRWSSISSSTITIGASPFTNGSGSPYISYFFHSVSGYSKVGSYSGGSSGSSNVIVIGFKPRFLIVKRTDQAGDAWQMFDSTMAGADTFDDYLQANTSAAEASYNQREVNFTNNGFYWTYAESGTNISGGNYIFLAIA